MLEELNLEELISIEGGCDPSHNSGHAIGKAVAPAIQVYGIYCLLLLF